MGKHDQLILKFLSENPYSGPSIMELMKRLNIPISEIGPTLDSLFNRHMVTMQVDHHGVERWFPAASTQGDGVPPESPAPVQMEPMPEPASASMPTSSFAELTSDSRGVGWPVFLIGLLVMGAAAAWVGGRYLAGDSVKAAVVEKADKKDFAEAVAARNLYETKTGDRLIALENKSKEFAALSDSLKTTQLRLKKLTVVVDSLKAQQAKIAKSKKARRR